MKKIFSVTVLLCSGFINAMERRPLLTKHIDENVCYFNPQTGTVVELTTFRRGSSNFPKITSCLKVKRRPILEEDRNFLCMTILPEGGCKRKEQKIRMPETPYPHFYQPLPYTIDKILNITSSADERYFYLDVIVKSGDQIQRKKTLCVGDVQMEAHWHPEPCYIWKDITILEPFATMVPDAVDGLTSVYSPSVPLANIDELFCWVKQSKKEISGAASGLSRLLQSIIYHKGALLYTDNKSRGVFEPIKPLFFGEENPLVSLDSSGHKIVLCTKNNIAVATHKVPHFGTLEIKMLEHELLNLIDGQPPYLYIDHVVLNYAGNKLLIMVKNGLEERINIAWLMDLNTNEIKEFPKLIENTFGSRLKAQFSDDDSLLIFSHDAFVSFYNIDKKTSFNRVKKDDELRLLVANDGTGIVVEKQNGYFFEPVSK